jgi:formylmethanofuran dehydrogenase subunit C
MREGAIHVEKKCATRVGASMTGGKIIVSGYLEEPMPTFTIDSVKPKVKLDDTETVTGPFYVFLGDLAENSSGGKLFVSKTSNPHLNVYERFL